MKNRGLIPGPLIVLIDILLTGLALCCYAYFHHVRPSQEIVNVNQIQENVNNSSQNDTSNNNNSINQNNNDNNSDDSETSNNNDSEPSSEFADFSKKFGDKFTSSPQYSDTVYSGPNSYVELTEVRENGVTYFVQDIYVKSMEYLQTGFANDSYGRSITDWTVNMAADNDAVCAVNGDYYGIHQVGLVIRNGYAYRTSLSNNTDLCIIYKNGVMETYSENELNVEEEVANGAYQAWSFGPELVVSGEAITDFGNNRIANENPRTGIGYYEPGHYCFVTVDGRNCNDSDGLTLKGFAQLFKDLGCVGAYNLDGGKSSVMVFNDKVINEPYEGGRKISDIVFVTE